MTAKNINCPKNVNSRYNVKSSNYVNSGDNASSGYYMKSGNYVNSGDNASSGYNVKSDNRYTRVMDDKTYYREWKKQQTREKEFDSSFNPLMLGVFIAVDIAIALRDEVNSLKNPKKRDRIKRELMRDLRKVRRPFYYEQETARRRALAAERRKIHRRSTVSPMPSPDDIMKAWEKRKESHEAMISLGSMLQDLECYVDNSLKFDETGTVVGRNGGIRGWLKENLPELAPKYKTLMRYKALAARLRQATGTSDPVPASSLLDEPLNKTVAALLAQTKPLFSHVFGYLEHELSPETVLLEHPKTINRRKRRRRS